MNELTLEIVQKFLKENEFRLRSTHKKVSFPILERIFHKLNNGERFRPIQVDNEVIVNGHHRYICLSILGLSVETIQWTRSPTSEIIPWSLVIVENLDWDFPNKT